MDSIYTFLNLGWLYILLWLEEHSGIGNVPELRLKRHPTPLEDSVMAIVDDSKLEEETMSNKTKLAQLSLLWL